jgi:deazaflavin-dependent oxidoreductase (nitroreductase family)
MTFNLHNLASEDFCYLTTTGRISGRPHTIEIWFALDGRTLYILAGGRDKSDWVRNVVCTPQVQVRIGETRFNGLARVVEAHGEEDARARKLVLDKYVPRSSDDLDDWSRTSLPVAVDLLNP